MTGGSIKQSDDTELDLDRAKHPFSTCEYFAAR